MRILNASFFFAIFLSLSGAAYADNISVKLRNQTSSDYDYEVIDQVCGEEYLIPIDAGETETWPFCSSGVHDSGYANIIFRKLGNSSWTEKSLISDGDTVTLN